MLAMLMGVSLGLGGLAQQTVPNLAEDAFSAVGSPSYEKLCHHVHRQPLPQWTRIEDGHAEDFAGKNVDRNVVKAVPSGPWDKGMLLAMSFFPDDPAFNSRSRSADVGDTNMHVEVRAFLPLLVPILQLRGIGELDDKVSIFGRHESFERLGGGGGASTSFLTGLAGIPSRQTGGSYCQQAEYQCANGEAVGFDRGVSGIASGIRSQPLGARIVAAVILLGLANFLAVRFAQWSLEERNFRLGDYLFFPALFGGSGALIGLLWLLFGG